MTKKKASGETRNKKVDREEKDITDALDRIIAKAKVENEALKEMLNKINPEESEKS